MFDVIREVVVGLAVELEKVTLVPRPKGRKKPRISGRCGNRGGRCRSLVDRDARALDVESSRQGGARDAHARLRLSKTRDFSGAEGRRKSRLDCGGR